LLALGKVVFPLAQRKCAKNYFLLKEVLYDDQQAQPALGGFSGQRRRDAGAGR
jgi:hypothetical protein